MNLPSPHLSLSSSQNPGSQAKITLASLYHPSLTSQARGQIFFLGKYHSPIDNTYVDYHLEAPNQKAEFPYVQQTYPISYLELPVSDHDSIWNGTEPEI